MNLCLLCFASGRKLSKEEEKIDDGESLFFLMKLCFGELMRKKLLLGCDKSMCHQ